MDGLSIECTVLSFEAFIECCFSIFFWFNLCIASMPRAQKYEHNQMLTCNYNFCDEVNNQN